MASFTNLPFTLSAEDAALFKSLQASALLPELTKPGEGELVQLFKQNKRSEEITRIEPYADLLEIKLKELLEAGKAAILAHLRESKSTAFTVNLFSWNTVKYYETLSQQQQRVDGMTPVEKADHLARVSEQKRMIFENGWEDTFGVETTEASGWNPHEEDTYWTHLPVKVDRIFRNSDLQFRLSLALGPNFFPSVRWQRLPCSEEHDYEGGFSVYKKTLFVTYHPFGVNKQQMSKLLAVAKKEAERSAAGKKVVYEWPEYGVGYAKLCALPEDSSDMPPLVAAPAPIRVAHHCFCGCEDAE